MERMPPSSDPIAEARRQWTAHGWASSAAGMSAVTSVIRSQQLLLGRVGVVLKPFGLSFSRFELLRLLAFTREGRLPLASVIVRLQVHPASATNSVDRLVRDGMIERQLNPDDRRAAILSITSEGRALIEEATQVLNEEVFARLPIPDRDAAELVRILSLLRIAEGDFAESGLSAS